MELFGFQINRNKAEQEEKDLTPSFIAPQTSDGAVELSGGSHTGTYLDLEYYLLSVDFQRYSS